MEFKELVDKNRSHREFAADVHIEREVIESWIKNATHAPATMNLQALKYKILNTPDEVASLLPHTRWAAALSKKLPPEGHGPSAFIVICHDTEITPPKPLFWIDAGIAAQTIMLSATEAGFGGCIIGSANAQTVSEVVGIGEPLMPVILLGIGVPSDTVVLTDATDGVKYYRDENNVHYVPKRSLEEVIIK